MRTFTGRLSAVDRQDGSGDCRDNDEGAVLQASNLLRALKQNREASALGLLEVTRLTTRPAVADGVTLCCRCWW